MLGLGLIASPGFAEKKWASHEPPTQAESKTAVPLLVKSNRPRLTESVRLRFRRPGEQRYEKVHAKKKNRSTWEIIIPAGAVQPPYLEYFIILQARNGKSHLVFGSPQTPHRLTVDELSALQPTIPNPSPGTSKDELKTPDATVSHPPQKSPLEATLVVLEMQIL